MSTNPISTKAEFEKAMGHLVQLQLDQEQSRHFAGAIKGVKDTRVHAMNALSRITVGPKKNKLPPEIVDLICSPPVSQSVSSHLEKFKTMESAAEVYEFINKSNLTAKERGKSLKELKQRIGAEQIKFAESFFPHPYLKSSIDSLVRKIDKDLEELGKPKFLDIRD